ncbi:LytR C-terminal domain-containing protein [Cellulomonas soli]|uniref:LytR C-terminal domain-containing protein n=1 Tax=Cellulomonas soli TaxID=931535 RepID=UPI003F86E6C6
MSKADYPYPPDEFDAPRSPDAPRDPYLAPRSWWSRWWPFVAVLVVVPTLAFVLVNLAARYDSLPIVGGDSGASEPAAEESAAAETPAEGETPVEETPAETPAPTPVLTTPVVVYNAAGIAGLAASTAETLTAAGFTAVTTGNQDAGDLADSVVYYGSEDLKVTADLVAQTLGIATVTLSLADAPGGISVVLLSAP